MKTKQQTNILVVDDVLENLQLLVNILCNEGYKIRPALSGEAALKAIDKQLPDLILLDIQMPGMNGYEVCRLLKEDSKTKHIPILFISALSDMKDKVKAFKMGGDDYINKPFQFEEVKARVETHLKLKSYQDHMQEQVNQGIKDVERLSQDIIDTQREVIFTMGEICETRSLETGLHVKRVAEYSYLLATLAGSEEAEQIKQASPMHDIGKVAIADHILNKPGKLTAEEWQVMKSHSDLGYKMLSASRTELLKMAAVIAHQHHEKWDGSGYPQGLKGEEISFVARIVAVADVFDALNHSRCYKAAWPQAKVLDFLKEQRGQHFDPQLIDLFFTSLDKFLLIKEKYKG